MRIAHQNVLKKTALDSLSSVSAEWDERNITDFMVRAKYSGRGYKYDSGIFVEYPSRISQAMRDVLYGCVTKKAITFIGHSIVYGQGAGDTEAAKMVSALPARVSARLNAYLGTQFDIGAIFCEGNQQPMWTLGGSASYLTYDSAGNKGVFAFLNAATKSTTITLTGSTVVIYALASAAGVSLQYSIDGGATTAATAAVSNPTGNLGWQYYPVTISGLSAGSHTITIYGPTSGQVCVIAAEGRTTSTGVVVHRCGVPAMVLPDMFSAALDATDTAGPATWLTATSTAKAQQAGSLTKLMSSSLVMLMFDVNDMLRGWTTYSYTLADCKRHLVNTLTQLNSLGQSVLVVIGPWLDVADYQSNGCPFNQNDLARVYREAVAASSNASLIDIRTPVYSRQGFSNAMMDGLVHPTALGANALGQKMADAMIAAADWI